MRGLIFCGQFKRKFTLAHFPNLPGASVGGACPSSIGARFEANIEIKRSTTAEGRVPTPTSTLEEAIKGVLHDIGEGAELLEAGHRVAVKRKAGVLTERRAPKIAKPSQSNAAKVDADGTIWTLRAHPEVLIHRARRVLAAAAAVNAMGYEIELCIGKRSTILTSFAADVLKIDWLVEREELWTVIPTGYLEEHRIVEFRHDKKSRMLVVPVTNADRYAEAVQKEKAIEINVEISRPSNPLLPDEPKFRICVTGNVVNTTSQPDFGFVSADSSRDAKRGGPAVRAD